MKALIKIPYYLLIVGVATVGVLLLATLVPIPGNFKVKIVKSGSMEPAIRTGSIVAIRPATSYEVGDVITFGPDTKTQIPTTHRIVAQKGEGSSRVFTTKGDGNDVADPKEVSINDVDGKVVFSVPYAGFVLDFARQPLGFFLIVGIPAGIVMIDEFWKIWIEVKKIRARKKKKNSSGDSDPEAKSEPKIFSYVKSGNVLDLRVKNSPSKIKEEIRYETKVAVVKKYASRFSWKTLVVIFVFIGPLLGFSRIGNTISVYNENESSVGNTLRASGEYDGVVGTDSFIPDESNPQTPPPLTSEEDQIVLGEIFSENGITEEQQAEGSSTEPVIPSEELEQVQESSTISESDVQTENTEQAGPETETTSTDDVVTPTSDSGTEL